MFLSSLFSLLFLLRYQFLATFLLAGNTVRIEWEYIHQLGFRYRGDGIIRQCTLHSIFQYGDGLFQRSGLGKHLCGGFLFRSALLVQRDKINLDLIEPITILVEE